MDGPWEQVSTDLALPACADPGWPRLADGALLLCVEGDGVELVVPLDGRPPWALGEAVRRPAVGGGRLVAAARREGLWSMQGGQRAESAWLAGELVSGPVTDGDVLGAAWEAKVARMPLGARSWSMIDARPAPGQPLALAGGQLWWSEVDAGGGLDLWTLDAAERPQLVAGGPGDQGFPVGDAERLVYADDGELVIRPVAGGEERLDTNTGFAAAPALDGGRLCWEERPDDAHPARWIRCLPEASVSGPVPLHDPSATAGALLVHGGGRAWLLGTGAQVAAVEAAVGRLP